MKKKLLIGMTLGSAVLVAACGDSATVTDNASEKSELTLEQVYEKTLERQQELKSAKANMKVDQSLQMEKDGQTFEMTSSSNLNMDMVIDPKQLYIEGTTAMSDSETKKEQTTPSKIYMTQKDGYYIYDPTDDSWFKLPQEEFDSLMNEAGIQNDPSEQLRQLEEFVEDFTFEQNDKKYILTLNAEGEKFTEFILEQAKTTLGGEQAEVVLGSMENLNIKDAQYVLEIDKKTFDMKNMKLDMVMSIERDGGTITIDQNATIDYSEFNTIDEIKIPQEIIDSVQEIE